MAGELHREDRFAEFFVEMLPRIVGFCGRLGVGRQDGEDIAVESLARAYARWDALGGEPWRAGWVFKVASRLVLDLDRSRRRVPAAPVAVGAVDETSVVVLRDALLAALGQLSRRQRDAVILRYLADLPEADVAVALGVSAGTVKTHLHRAMVRLRTLLGPQIEDLHFE